MILRDLEPSRVKVFAYFYKQLSSANFYALTFLPPYPSNASNDQ